MTPLIIGLTSVFFSFFNNFDILRIATGHLFAFVFSGWNISRLFIPKTNLLERIVSASLFSILLTYPATVIVTLIEGQSGLAIFSRHLGLSMTVLLALSLLLPLMLKPFSSQAKEIKKATASSSFSISPLFLLSLLIYSFFAFTNLNRADVYGDEYDLGYQAYNLVDGIKAGRQAYLISFSGHPPLAMSLKHFTLNLLEPTGLDYLSDWQFRFSEGILGLLTLTAVYLLAYQIQTPRLAGLTTLLLAVNNFFVWMGRIFHREMLLTFFMTLSVYFLLKKKQTRLDLILCGVALGAAMLTKETALLLLPVIILKTYFDHKQALCLFVALLLFSPVIVYNLLAFKTTGYADVFFSNLFGVYRPGATPIEDATVWENFFSIFTYLYDLYSPTVFVFMALGLIWLTKNWFQDLKNKKNNDYIYLCLWIIDSLIFFSVSAVRGYYLIFLSIPLTIILVKFLKTLTPLRIQQVILSSLFLYSFFYTYNSNLNRQDLISAHPGNFDGSILVSHPLNLHRSQVTVSWTFEWGYKHLVRYLEKTLTAADCLTVDPKLNPLAQRRYFWTNDPVKDYYLGTYKSRLLACNQPGAVEAKKYFLTDAPYEQIDFIPQSLPNQLGQFYLYQFDN